MKVVPMAKSDSVVTPGIALGKGHDVNDPVIAPCLSRSGETERRTRHDYERPKGYESSSHHQHSNL